MFHGKVSSKKMRDGMCRRALATLIHSYLLPVTIVVTVTIIMLRRGLRH